MTDAQQEQQNSCSIESNENRTGLPERKVYLRDFELAHVLEYNGPIDEWSRDKIYCDCSVFESVNNVNGVDIDAHELLTVLKEINSQNEHHKNMVSVLAFQIQQMAHVIQAQKDALAYCGVGLAEEKVLPS